MRLEKLRSKMEAEKLDGLIITQPHNRRYLSGFTGSAGTLIITKERQLLATDFRYYQRVRQECPNWELVETTGSLNDILLETLRQAELGGRQVGFETQHVTVAVMHGWERALQGRLVLVNTLEFVEELRMQKDAAEVASIRQAAAITDATWEYLINWIQPGMTERQVAWELESGMRQRGADAMAFDPIVASGPNSALPHATPSDRVLQKGEPITMDFGCLVNGYCSDLTRTICLGEPADDVYLTVWHTVLQAQQAALSGAKAGMTGAAVDKLARDIIEAAGHGDHFGHGLGHSLGLFIHESPRFSRLYPNEVPVGAVVTVEPGIYIPAWGGVRTEDLVLLTEDGVDVLSSASKPAVLAR